MLFLFDISGFIFRAFYALPMMYRPSDKMPVNAIYGVSNMLAGFEKKHNMQHVLLTFDSKEASFRKALSKDYKINRQECPMELIAQMGVIKDICDAFGFKRIEMCGYEADDIIASCVKKYQNDKITIVSSDKDLMQLINTNVLMFDPVKQSYIDSVAVEKKFGVLPHMVKDFLALVGDASDNIKGVTGIGPKTAAKLLNQYESIDNIYKNLDNLTPKMRVTLESEYDKLNLAKTLVMLEDNLDIPYTFDDLRYKKNNEDLARIFSDNGFNSLLKHTKQKAVYKKPLAQTIGEEPMLGIDAGYLIHNDPDTRPMLQSPSEIDLCSTYGESTNEIFGMIAQYNDYIAYGIPGDLKLGGKIDGSQRYDIGFGEGQEDIELMSYMLYGPNVSKEHIVSIYGSDLIEDCDQNIAFALLNAYFDMRKKMCGVSSIYYNIDLPLRKVLFDMEAVGISVDIQYLKQLMDELNAVINILSKQIYELADEEFNIASTKQLRYILFDKMQATASMQTTEHSILEELSVQGYVIADKIIEWRSACKLVNTYILPLIDKVQDDGRIHAKFLQTSTITGRLSCVNPNMQNIPVNKGIRKAFYTRPGWVLSSFDYSQIELRVLAHLSSCKKMIDYLCNGYDIHTNTAIELFGDKNKRSHAKAINFGIIYGMSAFGLAKALNITRTEAKDYIKKYFEEFPEIKEFMNAAKHTDTVKTMIGRRCIVRDHKNYKSKQNIPIQGSAADIMRLAMINIDLSNMASKMLLQVHDELIFEGPEEEYEKLHMIAKNSMENAYNLCVPLVVHSKIGWSY